MVIIITWPTPFSTCSHYNKNTIFTLQAFEEYVQKLLSKPSLRGSDLLYAFLRVPGEFSEMNSSPDALSRLLRKTVPLTLRKERGQHLEPFLNTFFTSTEGKKIRYETKQ